VSPYGRINVSAKDFVSSEISEDDEETVKVKAMGKKGKKAAS